MRLTSLGKQKKQCGTVITENVCDRRQMDYVLSFCSVLLSGPSVATPDCILATVFYMSLDSVGVSLLILEENLL